LGTNFGSDGFQKIIEVRRSSPINIVFINAGVAEDVSLSTSVRVPLAPNHRPRASVTAQSPRVISGDILGRSNFPDHGIIAVRRTSVQAFMMFLTSTTFVSIEAGDTGACTRRRTDESCIAISASYSCSLEKPWRNHEELLDAPNSACMATETRPLIHRRPPKSIIWIFTPMGWRSAAESSVSHLLPSPMKCYSPSSSCPVSFYRTTRNTYLCLARWFAVRRRRSKVTGGCRRRGPALHHPLSLSLIAGSPSLGFEILGQSFRCLSPSVVGRLQRHASSTPRRRPPSAPPGRSPMLISAADPINPPPPASSRSRSKRTSPSAMEVIDE
jgi:hypothetical protein